MDFISNLIKRPISLALNESLEKINANTSSNSDHQDRHDDHKTTKIMPTNINVRNSSSDSKRNVKINLNHVTSFDCFDNSLPSLSSSNNKVHTVVTPNGSGASSAVLDAGACGDSTSTIDGCENDSASNYLPGTSCTATSSTIEELLIQINDNLNQASLEAISDNDMPNKYILNELPSSFMITPTPTKLTSTNKFQSQTSQFSPIPLPSVAGSSIIESNSNINRICIKDLETDRITAIPSPEKSFRNSIVNKKATGLTESDESKIIEIHRTFNANTEDQRKLTFEEDIIPTLTASANTNLNSTIKTDRSKLQVLNFETDISSSVSSDNETYAECQTFLDVGNTNTGDVDRFECHGDNAASFSEGDTYRSAMNSYINNTVNIPTVDEREKIDTTLENVDEICDECAEDIRERNENEECLQNLPASSSHIAKAFSSSGNFANRTFDGNEDEPMDVSIVESFTLSQVEIGHPSDSTGIVQKEVLLMDPSTKSSENLTMGCDVTFPRSEEFSSEEIFLAKNKSSNGENSKLHLNEKSRVLKSEEGNVEIKNSLVKDIADTSGYNLKPAEVEHDKCNATTVECMSEKDVSVECTTESLSINDSNVQVTSSTEVENLTHVDSSRGEIANPPTTSLPPSSTLGISVNEKELNSNLIIDTCVEPIRVDGNNKTTHSPSFPLKLVRDNKQFPQSPSLRKSEIFLEKSDYNASNDNGILVSHSPRQIRSISHENPEVGRTPIRIPVEIAPPNIPESLTDEHVEPMDIDSSIQSLTPQKTLPAHDEKSEIDVGIIFSQDTEKLSAKEQIKSDAQDEKDIFVEKHFPFTDKKKTINISPSSSGTTDLLQAHADFRDDFQTNLILNPSDFDYLLSKGSNNVQIDRSSLLLKFDPLLGVPVPVNLYQQQQSQQATQNSNNNSNLQYLSPTLEEEEQHSSEDNNSDSVSDKKIAVDNGDRKITSASEKPTSKENSPLQQESIPCKPQQQAEQQYSQDHIKSKKNARMSVDVIKGIQIENDCKKSIECSNGSTQSDEIQNHLKMDDLEKKIKNEVLKTEDIEKKLKEAEQREEALIKRITEKDKTILKMNGVIEAYEKAIAELISEKEQLIQNYEKQLADIKADRDSNYHHLTSLETTFSDLHVKYEKSKEMTLQLKANEESLLAEKKQYLESLRMQEQRYEKMKNHAMQQLEIANKKLESLTKEHAIETTKLKALLKKEEISRASINEQLQQKSRENAELVKICDELINGQGS